MSHLRLIYLALLRPLGQPSHFDGCVRKEATVASCVLPTSGTLIATSENRRKRRANPARWKRNKAKAKLLAGEKYINSRGVQIPALKSGETKCDNCSHK